MDVFTQTLKEVLPGMDASTLEAMFMKGAPSLRVLRIDCTIAEGSSWTFWRLARSRNNRMYHWQLMRTLMGPSLGMLAPCQIVML